MNAQIQDHKEALTKAIKHAELLIDIDRLISAIPQDGILCIAIDRRKDGVKMLNIHMPAVNRGDFSVIATTPDEFFTKLSKIQEHNYEKVAANFPMNEL